MAKIISSIEVQSIGPLGVKTSSGIVKLYKDHIELRSLFARKQMFFDELELVEVKKSPFGKVIVLNSSQASLKFRLASTSKRRRRKFLEKFEHYAINRGIEY